MPNARTIVALLVSTLAGVLLIADRIDIQRLLGRERAPAAIWVDDRAALLSDSEHQRIAAYHEALRDAHDIDYRVLALSNPGDINRLAYEYFGAANVGEQSASGRGLLLVIDTALERVRLEVSTSLEGVYTDAFVAYVQGRQMSPFFRAGRIADGVLATTELIVGRAQDAEAGKSFAPPMPGRSMGGGATVATAIGGNDDPTEVYKQQTRNIETAGLEPLQVVDAYLEAMARRDARPDLPIYSADTATMLRHWVVTPAQMDNITSTYRRCTIDGVRTRGDLAVVRYRVEQRRCAPYFLRREQGAWRLDLTALSSLIRFNHNNEWRSQTQGAHEYQFAFEDWRFDSKGFPHESR